MSAFNPLNPAKYSTAEERQRRFEELVINMSQITIEGKQVLFPDIHEMASIYQQAEDAAARASNGMA